MDLRTTLRYTQLIEFPSEDFHSAVANTVEEARRLVGSEYVTEFEGVKLFRKRTIFISFKDLIGCTSLFDSM